MDSNEKTKSDANNSSAHLPATLKTIYKKYRHLDHGKVADYIPELGRADASCFGIAAVTTDGAIFECGDAQ